MSSIQVAILMEFAKSGNEPKKIPEIMAVLDETFKDIWKPKKGTIYPAIHQLAIKGFLKTHAVQPYGYSITESGLRVIKNIMKNINLQMEAYMQYYTYILNSYSALDEQKAKEVASEIVKTISTKIYQFSI
ncbi:MAG: PadR family transcriptional regulator [Candidatus Heimdallarchaeota archaeon]|nr:PadR family transcriptional regulator [Candidatus Heimdallarchaeota archaeon]